VDEKRKLHEKKALITGATGQYVSIGGRKAMIAQGAGYEGEIVFDTPKPDG
jgi:hypothetical protein